MVPGLGIVYPEFATLLGSPIGDVGGIEEVIETNLIIYKTLMLSSVPSSVKSLMWTFV